MKKKVCIITGATSGIGKEAAKSLVQSGLTVILACRNIDKAEQLCAKFSDETGNPDVFAIEFDLSSFRSIDAFCEKFLSRFNRLDVLINNAGVICDRPQKTKQGFEMTMGVNYIGTYYLTEKLLPILKSTKYSRIVNVTSIVGIKSNLKDEILDFYNIKHGMQAYAASKLALILYTVDLAERLKNCEVTSNALHPGVIATNIWTGEGFLMRATKPFMKYVCPPAIHGAKRVIHLALSPEVKDISGSVFSKEKMVTPKKSAANSELRKKLIMATQTAIKKTENSLYL